MVSVWFFFLRFSTSLLNSSFVTCFVFFISYVSFFCSLLCVTLLFVVVFSVFI
jgi:hypothetical protein